MSELAEALTKFQQEILRQIRTGQAVTVETTRLAAGVVASSATGRGRAPWMPEVPKDAREGQEKAIDAAFAFAKAVLDLNAEFARSLSRLTESTRSVSTGVTEPVTVPIRQSVGTAPTMPTMPMVPAMPALPSLPAVPAMPAMPSWPNPAAMQMPTLPGWSPTSLADSARDAAAAMTAAFGAAGAAALKASRAASATRSAAGGANSETPSDGTKLSVAEAQKAQAEAHEAAMRAQQAQAEAASKAHEFAMTAARVNTEAASRFAEDVAARSGKAAERVATALRTARGNEGDGAADESASTPVKTPSKSPTRAARTTATGPESSAATKKAATKKAAAKKPKAKGSTATKAASKAAATKESTPRKTAAKKTAATTSAAAKKAADTSAAKKTGTVAAPAAAVELPKGAVAITEDGSSPKGYDVKGNADSGLYHVPGSQWYDATEAEFWFASAEDAAKAGFKPAGGAAKQEIDDEGSPDA